MQSKYRLHRASGQAVVTFSGRDFYLGPYNSATSRQAYDRLIAEWLARGRISETVCGETTVTELIAAYWIYAQGYYRKEGVSTGSAENLRPVLRLLRETYGGKRVSEFRPLSLRTLQNQMLERRWCRAYINMNSNRIRRVFKWGVSEELVPLEVYEKLRTVPNLRKGRTSARETAAVQPVSDETVDATLPFLPKIVADMVQVQRFTGCRPGEIRCLRPREIDRGSEVWFWRPEAHKTQHHGKSKVIAIGPQAQKILLPYLDREPSMYCFSPAESEELRRTAAHNKRKTPLSCGNRPGTNKSKAPKRPPSENYSKESYRRAVERACARAFPPPPPLSKREDETNKAWKARLSEEQLLSLKEWHKAHRWFPNQLRHTAGTQIRKKFGLEASQVALGHSSANVTEIYAERDLALAVKVAAEVG